MKDNNQVLIFLIERLFDIFIACEPEKPYRKDEIAFVFKELSHIREYLTKINESNTNKK